jgi:hypothetical protein
LEHFAGMDIVVLHMEGFFAISLESLDGQVLFVIKLGDNKNLFTAKFLIICRNCIREIQFEKSQQLCKT